MILIVLASAPIDPSRRFCTSIPRKNPSTARLRHSNKSIATMRGLGKRIASEVTTAIITIAPLPEVHPVHSQNKVPSTQESVVRQKLTIA